MLPPRLEHYLVDRAEVTARLEYIDPRAYDKTRNYLDGSVTWLSPFLTHGITTTVELSQSVLLKHKTSSCYRFLFELAWREFFHRTWQQHGNAIFSDMREDIAPGRKSEIPTPVLMAETGIDSVDAAIEHLLSHGLMHNHARMWVAALACNQADTHWLEPARWFHAHLLDGDLASNTLSWQWTAGTFSDKQYRANQDNINRYSRSEQKGSWLDVSYEELPALRAPARFEERGAPNVFDEPDAPSGLSISSFQVDTSERLALRSIWCLDPLWQADLQQHIVFVDTDYLMQWPLSRKRWEFIEHWAGQCGAPIYHGSLDELNSSLAGADVIHQERPSCTEWPGQVDARDWLYPMPQAPYPSFSRFWKQVRPALGLK